MVLLYLFALNNLQHHGAVALTRLGYRFAGFTSTSEAQQVQLWNKLCGKAKVKLLITNQVLERKQQTTKATSSVLVIVRFLWGTEGEETNQQSSAPSAFS